MSTLTTTDRLKELLPQLFNRKKLEGDYYLRFQLTKEISGLIDLKYVQESLIIPGDRITPVANLPEYVVGLMNSRNQVFLAMDLAHLAGFMPETVNLRQYQTIIVQTDLSENSDRSDKINLFGFTVRQIEGIARILPEQFNNHSLEGIPDSLKPFIKGSVITEEQADSDTPQSNSWLIDIDQLIQSKVNS